MAEVSLSGRQARRIAIKAQGFGRERPAAEPDRHAMQRVIKALGVVQMDSVNVLVRSHYLPLFSRLGPYQRELLEAQAWGPKPSLFEYWGHEASLMPLAMQPLFRWRMARARAGETWAGLATFRRDQSDFIDAVLKRIERDGPVTGGDFAEAPRAVGWWNWSRGKRALEWLFWAGLITTRTRRGFERVYDLTERVIPPAVLDAPTPTEPEAHRALLLIAARALGVATAGDLRDYFRMPAEGIRDRVDELVEGGGLTRVSVQGWKQPAYLAAKAGSRSKLDAAVLLSPFDNLIWRRERAERLFGTRIRLEIYTPAHKREHGYYVLPVLLGDRIVARVDLKADRKAGLLRVQAAHLEQGADADEATPALGAELLTMSRWLGLGGIEVAAGGNMSQALATLPTQDR